MINAGLQRIPGDSSLYLSRGLLYAQLADYEKAEADFKTAERLDSSQTLSSYALDLAELEKNHPDQALLEVRSQLRAHPNSALHHYLLAKLLEKQGTDSTGRASQEAIHAALTAVKLKPNFVEARDLLASLYLGFGQYGAAIEQSQLALKYAPQDQAAMYHLIVALRHSDASGERDQIQALVKRLAESEQAARRLDTDRKRFKIDRVATCACELDPLARVRITSDRKKLKVIRSQRSSAIQLSATCGRRISMNHELSRRTFIASTAASIASPALAAVQPKAGTALVPRRSAAIGHFGG